jgi:hypothetical protein
MFTCIIISMNLKKPEGPAICNAGSYLRSDIVGLSGE